jgi:hypothetical protein
MRPARSPVYVGVGGFYEVNSPEDDVDDRFGARINLGLDDVIFGLGLRASADYARFGPIDGQGSLAVSGLLTYNLPIGDAFDVYVGAGGGYQLAANDFLGDVTGPSPFGFTSPFVEARAGLQFGLGGGLGVFVEGGASYYLDAPAGLYGGDQPIYPSVAAGIVLRP